MQLNGLPLLKAILTDETVGMFAVSFVSDPAFEAKFLTFSKDHGPEPMRFSVVSEEEHRVLGVLVRAGYPILRRDGQGKYYYLVFDRETIKEIAERYVLGGFTSNFDLEHDHDKIVEGVHLTQLFIKDSGKGISPAGFEDIEEGSLFGEFKVHDESVWEQLKKGTYSGLSLEGYFQVVPEDEPVIETVEDLLDYINKQ